jgi:SNF2 family DNA or RNA helicase
LHDQPLCLELTCATDKRILSLQFSGDKERPLDKDIMSTFEKTLYTYQIFAIQALIALEDEIRCWILADEMGLGKTLIVAAFLKLFPRGLGKPALIVVPKSTVRNWKTELKGVNLKVFDYGGPKKTRPTERDFNELEVRKTNPRI